MQQLLFLLIICGFFGRGFLAQGPDTNACRVTISTTETSPLPQLPVTMSAFPSAFKSPSAIAVGACPGCTRLVVSIHPF
jgi:hypothetical protein